MFILDTFPEVDIKQNFYMRVDGFKIDPNNDKALTKGQTLTCGTLLYPPTNITIETAGETVTEQDYVSLDVFPPRWNFSANVMITEEEMKVDEMTSVTCKVMYEGEQVLSASKKVDGDWCRYNVSLQQMNVSSIEDNIFLQCMYEHATVREVMWERKDKESDNYTTVLTASLTSTNATVVGDEFEDLVDEHTEDANISHMLILKHKSLQTPQSYWRCTANTQNCLHQNRQEIQLHVPGKYSYCEIQFESLFNCSEVKGIWYSRIGNLLCNNFLQTT